MTRSPRLTFTVGLLVLTALGFTAYRSFGVQGRTYAGPGGLILSASFDETGRLKPRAAVEIAGVPVGKVESISLGDDSRARVLLDVDSALRLPRDTRASIVTAGILGERYVALELGKDSEFLKPGDSISNTESALVLEKVIAKFVYGGAESGAPSHPAARASRAEK